MSKEAMKLALEALEKLMRFESDSWELGSCRVASQAIKALREALSAPLAEQKSGIKQVIELYASPEKPAPVAKPHEQEPVACANGCRGFVKYPAQRKPLTRDQVKKLITATGYDTASPQERTDFINSIRHAEVAHGIKENT